MVYRWPIFIREVLRGAGVAWVGRGDTESSVVLGPGVAPPGGWTGSSVWTDP